MIISKISNKTKNKINLFLLKLLRVLLFALILFVIIIPIIKVFLDTINASDYSDHYVFIPTKVTFNLYKRILRDYFQKNYLTHSLIIATLSSLIQVCVCSMAGFAFAKLKFKGSNFLFWCIIFTLFMTFESLERTYNNLFVYYPLFGIKFFGNKNAIFYLYMIGAGIKAPVFIYLFRNSFRNMDEEVLDQARIDGCSVPKTFLKVALPLAKDSIFSCFFITFIWEYNDYTYPMFFSYASSGFSTVTLEVAIGRFGAGTNAVALSMVVPILIIYLILVKTLFNSIAKDHM